MRRLKRSTAMNKLDKAVEFTMHHGSQIILVGLALYGLVEYLDFNRGFDYVLAVTVVVLLAEKAFSKAQA